MLDKYSLLILFSFLSLAFGLLISYLWSKMKWQQKIADIKSMNNEERQLLEKDILLLKKQLDETILQHEQNLLQEKQKAINEKNIFEKEKIKEIANINKIVENQRIKLQNWEEKWQLAQEDFKQKEDLMRKEFELLAQKILDDKSKKFTELNESNMKQILTPFQEAMKAFKDKVEHNEKESFGRHKALNQQLKELQLLNQRLSQEALNLTKALKGESKTQGIWGETILNRLLEKSGLEKNREYFVQQSFQAAEGTNRQRVQPDVIIQLPDNKKMIIDAKVSLTAYERYVNEDDENEQENFIKQHITSIKAHINGLAKKSYDELLEGETPEFILMFIPIEPAFSLALKEDAELYNFAFNHNIVMVTPSTLLATLKIVENMWRNEKQRENAFEIAKQAGALYDKFHGLVTDLEQIGNKLSNAQQSYNSAMNKLQTGKGNLMGKVEKLKQLGAKTKKQLPILNEEENNN